MREILFRGKRKSDGKFIYGIPTYKFDYIFNSIQVDSCDNYEVKPETVCQFTGVLDKNKTKVFENDTVLVHENICGEIKDWTAKVAFKGGSFCLVDEENNPICSLGEVCGTFEVISNE